MAVAPPAWCSCAAAPASAETRRTSLPRRSEEHTSELQSLSNLVCRLLLEKKKHQLIVLPDEHLLLPLVPGLARTFVHHHVPDMPAPIPDQPDYPITRELQAINTRGQLVSP